MTAVSVTARHIAKGKPRSPFCCPVAHAIAEAFPDAELLLAVEVTYVAMGKPGKWIEVDLPGVATRFIEAFDHGDPVEPFTFDLDYPAVTR